MKQTKKVRESKRPYARPRLTRIRIRVEESLLAGCKSQTGTAKPGPCDPCVDPGS